MGIEIPTNDNETIDLRESIAETVTLTPEDLKLNKELVDLAYEMEIVPLLQEEDQRSLLQHLSSLKKRLQTRLPYPISEKLLLGSFLVSSEITRFSAAALEGIRYQDRIGTDNALRMFAQQFDISAGVTTATHRILIVEDELNGQTTSGIERRDRLASGAGIITSPSEFAVYYGESIAYARELVELLRDDDSPTPGAKLFTDLVTRVRDGQFIPGILLSSFPDLVILGIEHSQRVYEAVYPVASRITA